MARVLLINPSMGDYYRNSKVAAAITLSPPLNLALLGGSLRRAGHEVHALDLEAEPAEVEERLRRLQPDVVGVSFRTPLFPQARRIAEAARRLCSSPEGCTPRPAHRRPSSGPPSTWPCAVRVIRPSSTWPAAPTPPPCRV